VTHHMDGTFEARVMGRRFSLVPHFGTETETLAEGEQVEPEIATKPDDSLEYTVQNETELLKCKLTVHLIDE